MALVESAGAAYVSTVTDTATSGTFTPTANSLIVAIAACGNSAEKTGTGFTISSTFSGTTSNTWTIRKVYVGASGSGLVGIWVMDAGSAPGSGAVTVTTAPTTAIDTCLIVRQFAGAQPAASQNGATNSAEGTINTISLTPNATGSEIVGGSGSGATGAAYTANGVTTIYGQTSGGNSTYAVFEGNALTTGGVAQVLGYTSTAQAVTGMAVAEILAATTATSSTPAGPAQAQFPPSHRVRYFHKPFGPKPRQPAITPPVPALVSNAPPYIQSNGNTGTSTCTVTLGATTGGSTSLLIMCTYNTPNTSTFTLGGTSIAPTLAKSTGSNHQIWMYQGPVTGTTVVITGTSGDATFMDVYEFGPFTGTATLDAAVTSASSGTSQNAGTTGTLVSPAEIIVGSVGWTATTAATGPGAPWFNNTQLVDSFSEYSAYMRTTSTASQSYTQTTGASITYNGVTISVYNVSTNHYTATLVGIAAITGSTQMLTERILSAIITVVGTVTRNVDRTLIGTAALVGTVTRSISRALAAVLTITGIIKVGFSFFNQTLPLGSLSSSIAGETTDLGIQFNVTSSGYILDGFWMYVPAGGDTTGSNYTFALYSTTNGVTGTQVGTTLTGTGTYTAGAWNFAQLGTPLSLVNGTTYTAVYHLIANDLYQYVLTYWSAGLGASGITSGPIFAPGTGTALNGIQQGYNQPGGASIAFPTTSLGSWYGIDVEVIGGVSAIQHLLTIASQLVLTGTIPRQVGKITQGTVTATGSVSRKIARTLAAVMVLVGSVTRNVQRSLTTTIVVTASVLRMKIAVLVAQLVVTASTQRTIGRILAGISTVTGSLARSISRTLTSIVVVDAVAVRKVSRAFSSTTVLSGNTLRVVGRTLNGTTVLTGNMLRVVSRNLSSVTVVTVSVTRSIQKLLNVNLVIYITTIRSINRTVVGVTTLTSTQARSITRIVTAVITVSAVTAMQKFKQIILAVITVVSPVITRGVTHTFAGLTAVTGVQHVFVGRQFVANIVATATMTRNILRVFTVVMSIAASVVMQKFKQVTLIALVAVESTVTRQVDKVVTGASTVGAFTSRACARTLNMTVTCSALTTKNTSRALTGAFAVTSSTVKSCNKSVNLTVVTTGALVRHVSRACTAQVVTYVNVARNFTKTFLSTIAIPALISTSSAITYMITAITQLALTSTTGRSVTKIVTGQVVATGTVIRKLSKIIAATTAITVSTVRSITRTVSAMTAVYATTASTKFKIIILAATAALTATTTRSIDRSLTAVTAIYAFTVRNISRTVIGTATVTGIFARAFLRVFATTVAVTAAAASIKLHLIIMQALIAVDVVMVRRILPNLVTVITMGSVTIRSVSRAIQGTFAVAGQTLRTAGRTVTSVIVATVILTKQPQKLLDTMAAISVSVTRHLSRIISSIIPVTIGFTRKAAIHLTFAAHTAITATTIAGRAFYMTLTTMFTISGSILTTIRTGGQEIVVRYGVLGVRWLTSSVTKRWRTPGD